ncbi:MAG TPA: ATP-binding protein [Candidatus Binataceae bacterium]|nr:ATP-binding protein [Candidatus Binataceae bacterium]
MKLSRACGCDRTSKRILLHHSPTDSAIVPEPEEIAAIREQLATIEELLARLFGPVVWSREPKCLTVRALAADLIERHFDGIAEQWTQAVRAIFSGPSHPHYDEARIAQLRIDLSNALSRLVDHIRDPDDIRTYVHLRRHCQEGMLARAKPSEFNTIHIALKQVILSHVKFRMAGPRMERVRDVVVAAIDERRLMVSQFYIESRERMLRESEEKYRNSINHAPDPMYEVEPHTWLVLAANSAAEKLHLETPGEEALPLLGRPLMDFVPVDLRAGTLKFLEEVVSTGLSSATDLPLGGGFFYDANGALISYGNRSFVQVILRDVTQRHEILDSLLKAERLAAAGTFAAGVAHEVNNPLASISSLVQSLQSGEDDEQRRATLHTILSQITRISGTLKDLMNFARPASGQRRPVNINSLVDETLRLASYNKRLSGIRIDPLLAPDLKPAFAGDKEIQQVLLNLLLNAADASPAEGGVIRVITENGRAGKGPDKMPQVAIKVVDNGKGIPRENLERIFDPFFTTKPAGLGSGLGLPLCQLIVLANHGTIRVDSEVGRGTEVTIALPVPDDAACAMVAP